MAVALVSLLIGFQVNYQIRINHNTTTVFRSLPPQTATVEIFPQFRFLNQTQYINSVNSTTCGVEAIESSDYNSTYYYLPTNLSNDSYVNMTFTTITGQGIVFAATTTFTSYVSVCPLHS
jgi:hypothetical protein